MTVAWFAPMLRKKKRLGIFCGLVTADSTKAPHTSIIIQDAAEVPELSGLILLGSGLVGLAVGALRRKVFA